MQNAIRAKLRKSEKVKMKRFWPLGQSKARSSESRRLLLDNVDTDAAEGSNQAVSRPDCTALEQSPVNTEQLCFLNIQDEVGLQELAELLGVSSEDEPEVGSGQQGAARLIQRSVTQHFPLQTPDQSLEQHLFRVQETLHGELVRLAPLLQSLGLMGSLIDGYHRQTFAHLHQLLQGVSSSKTTFVLLKWVLHTYLSEELLHHPDIQEADPVKEVDLLLFTDWVTAARDKLCENVQKDVSATLDNILQNEKNPTGCDPEEAFVRLYTDTIQYLNAMTAAAHRFNSTLSDCVRDVCFQELLTFLRRYKAEQTELLGKYTETDKLETVHFFKTLNNCREIKQHVQKEAKGIKKSLFTEITALLEDMEASTMKLLMETVASTAQSHLKSYFTTSNNKQYFLLIDRVTAHFPKLTSCPDSQTKVMEEVYKLIAHIYLEHLVRTKLSKLQRCWGGQDVGETVTSDAERLHATISDLAPGVPQCNLMLLGISELLDCSSTDAVKITLAHLQKESPTWSEDLQLLPALLRWKGLSGWRLREVLDALPGQEAPPVSCCCCW